MRTNVFGLASVMSFAVAVTTLGVGCGGATTEGDVAPHAESVTTSYDKLTVVTERDARGVISATPKNAAGEAILVLRVEGDHIEIAPRASTLAPWSGSVPVDVAQANELTDWSYLAYAYAAGLRPEARADGQGGIAPQMISAGTDGQMCIAAGGTTAQCAYWLYCSRHWCPLW